MDLKCRLVNTGPIEVCQLSDNLVSVSKYDPRKRIQICLKNSKSISIKKNIENSPYWLENLKSLEKRKRNSGERVENFDSQMTVNL